MISDQLLSRFPAVGALVAALGIAASGCAVIEKAELEQAKQIVSERAKERWALVAKGDAEKSYQYLSPASRETVSLALHARRVSGGRWWRSMELEKVDCDKDTCRVTMNLVYDLRSLTGLTRTVEEVWIKDGDAWWLVAGK